jgi:acetylglutamate kinase
MTVVKVGGALIERPLDGAAAAVAAAKPPMIIVHGGGVQITRMLERMNVKSTFIEGLRVTDEQTLAAVSQALLGEVHTKFVAALHQMCVHPVGVFGVITASRRPGPWGFVGTGVGADDTALRALCSAGKTPVVATLGVGATAEESLLNINGDETAAAVAVAVQADELAFLTDVEGVRDADGVTLERVQHPDELLGAPYVSGGMVPKLRAVKTAMEGGVPRVRVGRTIFGGIG